MKALASTITLTTHIDIDNMTPDHQVNVDIEPEFSFLASHKDVIAAWLRSIADQIEGKQPEQTTTDQADGNDTGS
jgi:hypothetical protein